MTTDKQTRLPTDEDLRTAPASNLEPLKKEAQTPSEENSKEYRCHVRKQGSGSFGTVGA